MSHSAWAGRCEPFKRISANWSMGEDNARRDIIARLWRQYLAKMGLPLSDCPYQDLL